MRRNNGPAPEMPETAAIGVPSKFPTHTATVKVAGYRHRPVVGEVSTGSCLHRYRKCKIERRRLARLLAVIDASSVMPIRSAAVSWLATRLLANSGASRLTILGVGVQAMTHLEAMLAVRPITHVRIWRRTQAT